MITDQEASSYPMDKQTHTTHFTQVKDAEDTVAAGFGTFFTMVYSDLEHLAHGLMRHERDGHTLGTHGLMHEAFSRLLTTYQKTHQLETMEHSDLRSLTAVVMRRVLVDHARKRKTRLYANDVYSQCLDQSCKQMSGLAIDLVTLDEALVELEIIDPRKARIVELRFFGAMPMSKVASMIECPLRTVERDWSFARAWLCGRINEIKRIEIEGRGDK